MCTKAEKFMYSKSVWRPGDFLKAHPLLLKSPVNVSLTINYDTYLGITFLLLNYSVWERITDEVSVPDIHILSILLIKSEFKWCIHLSRSLFSYLGVHEMNSLSVKCITDLIRISKMRHTYYHGCATWRVIVISLFWVGMAVFERVEFNKGILPYTALHNMCPEYIADIFKFQFSSYGLRFSSNQQNVYSKTQ